jgi:peptidoglycan hydrolase CwlO-like protein
MKRTYLLITALGFLLFSCSAAHAQTTDRMDQAINDLLKEVRLLRKDLRQITASAYRANALIERLRLQQGQVNRLTQELNTVRSQLREIKYSRNDLIARLKDLEKNVDAGLTPQSETEAIKTTLAELERREAELMT